MQLDLPDALATPTDVAEHLAIHRKTLPILVADRGFPKPIIVGPHTHRWRWSDVRAWTEQQQS